MILGLDIGGANTKAASSDGLLTESVYLPLWRNAPLAEVLQRFSRLEPEAVAVVITGELADCFSCKSEGIEAISAAVREAFGCPVHFWGVTGFGSRDLAGANWSASAALLMPRGGRLPLRGHGQHHHRLDSHKRRAVSAANGLPAAGKRRAGLHRPAQNLPGSTAPRRPHQGFDSAAISGAVRHNRRCLSGRGPDHRGWLYLRYPGRRRKGTRGLFAPPGPRRLRRPRRSARLLPEP